MSKKILVLEKNTWLQAYHIRNFELGILQDKIPWINEKYINCYYKPACGALFDYVCLNNGILKKAELCWFKNFDLKNLFINLIFSIF